MAVTLVDASALYAAYDRRQPEHTAVVAHLRSQTGPWLISPLNLAEYDYLAVKRLGAANAALAAHDIADQLTISTFSNEDLRLAAAVAHRYADLGIGLADASIVVLAARHNSNRILTLDRRHFSVIRPVHEADHFVLLP